VTLLIEQLVGTAQANAFRKRRSPRDGFLHPIATPLFEQLRAIPELRDGHALTKAFGQAKHELASVEVFSPPAPGAQRLRVRGSAASKLARHFDSGFYLHFAGIDHFIEPLGAMCRSLERELGLPEPSFAVNAFATKTANTAEPHLDPVTTFHIQLHGTKTWWLAKKPTVSFPRAIDGAALPPDATRHEVSPGTLVYLPPGVVHATTMDGPSLGLLFVATGDSLANRIANDALRTLQRDAELRAPALYQKAHHNLIAARALRALADDLLTRTPKREKRNNP